MVLPSVGGHPGSAWLEPGVAVIGLSRHQARALGRAYGQLAVYELQGATRWVIACGNDDILAQTVVRHRGRQPPSPVPSAPPQPEVGAGVSPAGARSRVWRRPGSAPPAKASFHWTRMTAYHQRET